MAKVSGVVQQISEKWETNAGKKLRSPLYSVKLDDGDWYGFGFNNPNVKEGDPVTFEAVPAQYGKGKDADASTVKVLEAGSKEVAAVATKADARQTSIVYQSQHRDALDAISFMVDKGIVKLPTKQADQYDVFLGLVEDLTVKWTKEALSPVLESDQVESVEEGAMDDE